MRAFISRSAQETKRIAGKILAEAAHLRQKPIVFALRGNLGSGKTTFVQGLAQALGIRGKVQSPTFVLAKWYQLSRRANRPSYLVHVDAYRLEKLSDARAIGLRDAFKNKEALVVIEWADRIRKLVPRDSVWITFRHKANRQRVITVRQ